MFTPTMKLYRVTFTDGTTKLHRASSPRTVSLALSHTDGADIRSMEIVAVDAPMDGKQARKVARLAGVQTRHMAAFPAKVVSRFVLTPSATVALGRVTDRCVTFHLGGAR